MEGGQWTDLKLECTPLQFLRCRSREHESRGRESPSKTSMSSEPRLVAQAATRSGTTKEHNHTQIAAESQWKNASEPLRMEQERLDRRNEVIDEALAEEVRREEQWKKRSDRAAAEAPETEPTAAPVSEPREDPIESISESEEEIVHEISVADSQWQWTGKRMEGNPR